MAGIRLALSHSPSGNFLIRPASATRRDAPLATAAASLSLESADVGAMGTVDIEREFLELDLLTDDKLRQLAGTEDLGDVKLLSFRVDATDQSISQLGRMLPCLRELCLDRSIIHSFRDFGTSLRRLETLRLGNSRVQDLDGVGALEALRRLYLTKNRISCLTPLAMHDNLEELDLSHNHISDPCEIDQLGTCFKLQRLSLAGNPISRIRYYRRLVVHFLPQLRELDGLAVSPADQAPIGEHLLHTLTSEAAQLETLSESTEIEEKEPASPGSDMIRARPSTPRGEHGSQHSPRPSSARRGRSSASMTRLARTSDCSGQSNTSTQPSQTSGVLSASSELTHGADVVFAGNLAASMRRRKRAARLDTNVERLRIAALALQGGDEDDELLLSARSATIDDDSSIEKQLEDLLARSSGLEKEFRRLRTARADIDESPRTKQVRSKAKPREGRSGASRHDQQDRGRASATSRRRRRSTSQNQRESALAEGEIVELPSDEDSDSTFSERPSSEASERTRACTSSRSPADAARKASVPSSRSGLSRSWKPVPPPQVDQSEGLGEAGDLAEFECDLGFDFGEGKSRQ